MFESLKKKLASWLGTSKEKPVKKEKKSKKQAKTEKKGPKKDRIRKEFNELSEKIAKLESLKRELEALDTRGFEIDVKIIKSKLKNVDEIPSISKDIRALENKIRGKVAKVEQLTGKEINSIKEIPKIEGEIHKLEKSFEKQLSTKEEIISKLKRETGYITKTIERPEIPRESEEPQAKKIQERIETPKEHKETKKEEESNEAEEILEETEKEVTAERVEKKEGFFSRLFKKFSSAKISQEDFEEIFSELEIILFENNVAIDVVEKIKQSLGATLVGSEVKKTEIEKKIMSSLKEAILDLLIEPPNLIEQIKNKKDCPFVMLFFGINGSGKTTSIAKLASKLKKSGISVIIAAADTFRAASIEQLRVHGQNLGIEIVAKEYGSDPAAVAFDAIQYAKNKNIRVVLIDTAGRMYTKQNLMREMEKIVRISKPDLKIFVGESITGNDATEQARTFSETAGIDGIILSKADIDEKAGTILSVSYVTKKPIYFLGVGQDYKDLADFKKANVLEHLGLK